MPEGTGHAQVAGEATKRSITDIHSTLRRELPRLEGVAWGEARGRTSREAVKLMKAIDAFKSETFRHLKVAESLVLPFVGEPRAAGLMRQHLADQRVVEKALATAMAESRGDLTSSLRDVEATLTRLFELERRLERAR